MFLVSKGIDELAKGIAWVWNKFGGHIDTTAIDAFTDDLKHQTIELAKAAKQNVDEVFSGDAAAKAMAYFDQVTAEANKRGKESRVGGGDAHLNAIQKSHAKSMGLLGELAKAAEAGWKKVTGVIDSAAKKMQEVSRKMGEEAKSLIDQYETPLEKEKHKIDEVEKLFAAGKLTESQRENLERRITFEFDKDVNFTPKAVTAGSQEAFNLIDQINNRARDEKEAVPEKQLTEAEKQTGLLKRIAGAIGGGHMPKLALATLQ